MNPNQTTSLLRKIVDASVIAFSDGIKFTQKAILNNVNGLLRNLNITGQDITISTENLKVLRTVREDLKSTIITPEYKAKVNEFISGFDAIKKEIDNYFLASLAGFDPNKQIFTEILKQNINITKESLLGAGIDENIIKPVADLLNQNITSGAMISDLEEALRIEIIGDNQRLGKLERYTTQITRDSLNQYASNYNQAISSTSGMEWYYYSGSIIDDTRIYCQERAGKYFHKKEVEKVPAQWPGRIPGTNSSTIFTYRGGYNCRHQYLAVLIDVVPSDVINRNILNGNYIPVA